MLFAVPLYVKPAGIYTKDVYEFEINVFPINYNAIEYTCHCCYIVILPTLYIIIV